MMTQDIPACRTVATWIAAFVSSAFVAPLAFGHPSAQESDAARPPTLKLVLTEAKNLGDWTACSATVIHRGGGQETSVASVAVTTREVPISAEGTSVYDFRGAFGGPEEILLVWFQLRDASTPPRIVRRYFDWSHGHSARWSTDAVGQPTLEFVADELATPAVVAQFTVPARLLEAPRDLQIHCRTERGLAWSHGLELRSVPANLWAPPGWTAAVDLVVHDDVRKIAAAVRLTPGANEPAELNLGTTGSALLELAESNEFADPFYVLRLRRPKDGAILVRDLVERERDIPTTWTATAVGWTEGELADWEVAWPGARFGTPIVSAGAFGENGTAQVISLDATPGVRVGLSAAGAPLENSAWLRTIDAEGHASNWLRSDQRTRHRRYPAPVGTGWHIEALTRGGKFGRAQLTGSEVEISVAPPRPLQMTVSDWVGEGESFVAAVWHPEGEWGSPQSTDSAVWRPVLSAGVLGWDLPRGLTGDVILFTVQGGRLAAKRIDEQQILREQQHGARVDREPR